MHHPVVVADEHDDVVLAQTENKRLRPPGADKPTPTRMSEFVPVRTPPRKRTGNLGIAAQPSLATNQLRLNR
jgi:hypothetical protein